MRVWFCRNCAKVGRLSRALISKLVERKGEGAAAEGYKWHIRPLSLIARKTKTQSFLLGDTRYYNSVAIYFSDNPVCFHGSFRKRLSQCSSWCGLVFLAEGRSFGFRTGVVGGLLNGSRRRICVITTQPPSLPSTACRIWLLGTFKTQTEQHHLHSSCFPLPLSFFADSSKAEILQKWLRYFRSDFRNICR